MTDKALSIERRIRVASRLTGSGLLAQGVTLLGIHPLAFVAFIAVGAPLIVAGVAVYLWALAGGKAAGSSTPGHGSPRRSRGTAAPPG